MSRKEYSVADLCEVLRLAFAKNNQIFFGYSWREKLGDVLEEESRYARLVDWLNEQIEIEGKLINIFCPADNTDEYTETYLERMKNYAVYVHLRDLLLDSRTTTAMRSNIEKWLCKHSGAHYNEYLDSYV